MRLTTEEYAFARKRLLDFKIVYQEVYNELLDHVFSDMENRRTQGDARPAELMIEDVIHVMGGTEGIKNMALEHARLFRVKLNQRIGKVYRKHLILKTIAAMTVCFILSTYLPDSTATTITVFALLALLLLSSSLYIGYRMRVIQTDHKKYSLLRTTIFWQAFIPMTLLNVAVIAARFSHVKPTVILSHPAIPIMLFYFTALYLYSCYRVMNEEMQASNA
ncbi:hypothetical protein [Mucilaginibacter paludis]|uniref:Uncharacterized protein n=1 Tax=Mucilaginibacter paludis DSM 18603 TaxID=714943 RepID=H1Y8G3_9SPHI|nr:hypothetical protein [Mucilaginibacter paludis]EHQ25881.1 hypothetical protein Mucpa_1727 [Mucilaginibacter paludis DSM 18603]